nr:beta-ketoacyl synthase N-terminal-like domain-containing protein [uncultured Desulfuromonas sp.]
MNLLSQPIAIQGLSCIGGFGRGGDAFIQALQDEIDRPQCSDRHHGDGQAYYPAFLAKTDGLDDFVPKRALRRLDHYSRLALLGGSMALADAGITEEKRENIGVIVASGYGAVATTFGFLDSVLEDGDHCASPTAFSNSVHNVAGAYLSMQLGIHGPNLTLSQFEMSVSAALHNAVCWLQQGRVDTVLVGGVDEHCDVLNYCYGRYFANDPVPSHIEPFALEKQTAIPGEGAAFLVLCRDPKKARYGYIDALCGGHVDRSGDTLIQRSPVLLGVDGHRHTASWYRQSIGTPKTSCSHVYGSLPCGQAFDLVAAALMVRDQSCYALCSRDEDCAPIRQVTSVKCAADGQFGAVRVTRGYGKGR